MEAQKEVREEAQKEVSEEARHKIAQDNFNDLPIKYRDGAMYIYNVPFQGMTGRIYSWRNGVKHVQDDNASFPYVEAGGYGDIVVTSSGHNDCIEYVKAVFTPESKNLCGGRKFVGCSDPIVDPDTALFEIHGFNDDDLSKLRINNLRQYILDGDAYTTKPAQASLIDGYRRMDEELEPLAGGKPMYSDFLKSLEFGWSCTEHSSVMFIRGENLHFAGDGWVSCTVIHKGKRVFQYSKKARDDFVRELKGTLRREFEYPVLPHIRYYLNLSHLFIPDEDTYIFMSSSPLHTSFPWWPILCEGLRKNWSLASICEEILGGYSYHSACYESVCFLVKFK